MEVPLRKGSTSQYSYGYKRFSLIGAVVNSIVLVTGSIYILAEAVPRIFNPQEVSAPGMFFLAIAGIVINGAAVLRTRKGSSINERVIYLHLLEDALGWAAVLVGSVVMHFTGLSVIDPILSVIIAGFVLFNVYRNIRSLMPILLQGTPPDIDRARIVSTLTGLDDVSGVHDLHIWSLDERYNVLTVHVSLTDTLPADRLAELKATVRALLAEADIHHATIEFEAPDEECALLDCCAI